MDSLVTLISDNNGINFNESLWEQLSCYGVTNYFIPIQSKVWTFQQAKSSAKGDFRKIVQEAGVIGKKYTLSPRYYTSMSIGQ